MKALLCLLIVMVLTVGCGTDSTGKPNLNGLNALRGILAATNAVAMNGVQKLDLSKLPEILNEVVASGALSSESAAVLQDPANQQILMDVLQLAKGGPKAVQQTAVVRLTAAADGQPKSVSDVLTQMLTILSAVSPIIMSINPAIGGVLNLITTILPIILSLIGSFH